MRLGQCNCRRPTVSLLPPSPMRLVTDPAASFITGVGQRRETGLVAVFRETLRHGKALA